MWSNVVSREECLITEAFQVLPVEKQKAILEAAAAEFAEHGFKGASTNRIVQTAQIGKGMLFYYFGSKLTLYHTLLDQILELIDDYVKRMREGSEGEGFIETAWYAARVKMEAYLAHPGLLDLLARFFLHPEDAAVSEHAGAVVQRIGVLQKEMMGTLFAKADQSKFRQDIPPERLKLYLGLIFEGYSQHVANVVKASGIQKASELDWKPLLAEFDGYLADLKTIFYGEQEEA